MEIFHWPLVLLVWGIVWSNMCWRALFSNETGHFRMTWLSGLLYNWDTWYQCSILPLFILQILNIMFCSHEPSSKESHCSFGHNSKSVLHSENIGLSALLTFLNPTQMKECNALLMGCWSQDAFIFFFYCVLSAIPGWKMCTSINNYIKTLKHLAQYYVGSLWATNTVLGCSVLCSLAPEQSSRSFKGIFTLGRFREHLTSKSG